MALDNLYQVGIQHVTPEEMLFMHGKHPQVRSMLVSVYNFTLLGNVANVCDPHIFSGPFISYVREDDDYYTIAKRFGTITGETDWEKYRLSVVANKVPYLIPRPSPTTAYNNNNNMRPSSALGKLSLDGNSSISSENTIDDTDIVTTASVKNIVDSIEENDNEEDEEEDEIGSTSVGDLCSSSSNGTKEEEEEQTAEGAEDDVEEDDDETDDNDSTQPLQQSSLIASELHHLTREHSNPSPAVNSTVSSSVGIVWALLSEKFPQYSNSNTILAAMSQREKYPYPHLAIQRSVSELSTKNKR